MATVFDTQAYLDALTPPVFRHQGQEFVGRFLSVPEHLALIRHVATAPINTFEEVVAINRHVMQEIFPPNGDGPHAVDVWETLPFRVQQAMAKDFFDYQVSDSATLTRTE